MTALSQGLRRALGAPRLLLLLWAVNVLVALPAAVLMAQSIHDSVGKSRLRERLREGLDTGWYGEFQHGAEGVASTLAPSQVGIGAWLDNLDELWSGRIFLRPWGVVATGGLFALLWLFLLGGILERLRHPRGPFSIAHLLAAGSGYFFRFLRLAVLSGILYWLVFRFAWKLFPWIERRSQDVTVETTVLLYNLLGAALVVFLLVLVKMVFDYAKVAMVVEQRRSALGALRRGAGFVLRRPLATFGLMAGFGVLLAGLFGLYALLAPGAGQAAPWAIVGAFLVGQLFLVAKLFLRLGLLGSELALYERRPAPQQPTPPPEVR